MNFNSIGSSSNYARAAQYSANDFVKMAKAARSVNPDYGKMVMNAGDRKSALKKSAVNAEANVAIKGIQATGKIKGEQIVGEATRGRDKAKRKAGALAAAGKLFGNAGQFLGEKRTKREVGSEDAWYDERIKTNRDRAAEIRAGIDSNDTPETPDVDTTGGSSTNQTSGSVVQGDAWSKLSKVIRFGEGTSGQAGYNTQFTGTQFQDMSAHPRQLRSGGGYTSDAAGAYQFLSTTWDGAKNALNLPDFSPASQEKAGRYLTQQRGVNPDQVFTNINDFKSAMDKLAPEWASLPYSGVSPSGHGRGSSYYGQGGKSIDELWAIYNQ